MKTMTANQSLTRVQKSAESLDRAKPQRFPDAASVGDCFRQGDLYITKLADVPAGASRIKRPSAQLAEGNTQGSRHVLDSLDSVAIYQLPSPTVLDGPVIETKTDRTITHPEHGHVTIPPGVYGITYQRQHAEELRRVAD